MEVQWFPGHMAKTRRLIQEHLKLVDVVIEIVDARIPLSSRNPLLDELVKNKPRLIVLNKADLADDSLTNGWINKFNQISQFKAIKYNSTIAKGQNLNVIKEALISLTEAKRKQRLAKGIKSFTIRTMIVGIPNVGKSTFINALVGKGVAKTGNKPGVTRGNQWIRLDKDIDLLDTPGILWPKFEDPEVGFRLAVSGAINDDVFDFGEAALKLITYLIEYYPEIFMRRYKLEEDLLKEEPLAILEKIAVKRGAIVRGKGIDYTRISAIIIHDFRDGKLGKITLERP